MTAIVLIGTLDTKGAEYEFLRDRIREQGAETIIVDVGSREPAAIAPDITAAEVAAASRRQPADPDDRGLAVAARSQGAEAICLRLLAEGRLDGVIALGGSGGTYIATRAMRALPVGIPKVMVSTMASGNVRQYVGTADITMTYSVVDIAGLNPVLKRIIANAAAAVVAAARVRMAACPAGPAIAASMFGITTPGVTRARMRLEELGYTVLVFHANGTGGRALESLAESRSLVGVLDLTTTELADELAGGIFSAGSDRLGAAARAGLPQVVSLGALDVVDFGPVSTLPPAMYGRTTCIHNPGITLVRTTPRECRELGRLIGRKLSRARGHVAVFVPLRGVSALSTKGGPFFDPDADQALVDGLHQTLRPSIEVHELDMDINDAAFALAAADRMHELIKEAAP
jgi:uncharacterized protein (UPF0261 family)